MRDTFSGFNASSDAAGAARSAGRSAPAARPVRSAAASVARCQPIAGLCRIACPNKPAARGEVSSIATAVPPADSPNRVTRDGSPPNARMLSCTQRSAATWSSSP